jgi:hypothetical protein
MREGKKGGANRKARRVERREIPEGKKKTAEGWWDEEK